MEKQQERVVVGVFESRDRARQAIEDLQRAGFTNDSIGYASRDAASEVGDVPMDDVQELNEDATEGAVGGVAAGGLLGGILGAGAAVLIPGVGPVVAAGILAAGVAGGAFAGGIAGPFINMGATKEEAHYYDQEFQAGRSLVTVNPGDRHSEARDILAQHGATNVHAE